MRLFKIFLASPGDTSAERIMAEEVVDEINKSVGSRDNFRLELLKWEHDTYPTIEEYSQEAINKQMGGDFQIFVGIMWKRFGTPTPKAGSGTEEEFELAYNRYKEERDIQIMFYFNSSPIPQNSDLIQAQKVMDFKKKLQGLGAYYFSYESDRGFEKQLRMDLIRYVKDTLIKENEEIKEKGVKEVNDAPVEAQIIPEIKEKFKNSLLDLEAIFAHKELDKLTIEDIYIAPDLKDLSNDSDTAKVVNLDDLTDAIDIEGVKIALIGNDSSGKSTTSKYLFLKYFFEMGLYPVLFKGTDFGSNIRKETITKLIEEKISEQYDKPFKISEIDSGKIILIIDDFHKATKGKNRYWPLLMSNIEELVGNVIVTGSQFMLMENVSKKDPFGNFELYNIYEFGPKFRYELVNKWNTLGKDLRYIDHNDILRKNDAYISHIKSIIGKNYIPSYPFYLLSILQALESGNVQNPNYSIHGFYYEVLINDCFAKAVKDKKEISLYYNYLTQFCFFLFEQGETSLTLDEFSAFHEMYCKKQDLTYKKETILETFDSARLLEINGNIAVKEKYIYYFFVAKYIANELPNKDEIKELVTKMCERLFRDEYASIIMFVTHLSKDNFIVSELVRIADSLFPENNVAQLQDDIDEINQLVESIPEQVLEIVNVDEQRNEELEDEDDTEKLEKELENETTSYDSFSLDDDVSTIDFFAKITRALKTIDILGQVTKKQWGELDGEQKLNLVSATYNVGLKTMDFYLQILQRNSKEIVEQISLLIKEKHFKDKNSLEKGIEEASRNFVFRLCFMSAFGITKRISNAIGYDKLVNSFQKALELQPYNSVKLIDLSIKLGYSNIASNMDLIDEYKEDVEKNKLSMVVLQNIVMDYMYMFDTDFKTRSKICNTLGISVQEQLKIDHISTQKKKK